MVLTEFYLRAVSAETVEAWGAAMRSARKANKER